MSNAQNATVLVAPGNFNGDTKPDLLVRDTAGALLLYPGNGAGGFGTSSVVGTGWNGMTAILGPGDWDGDGKADVLARDTNGACGSTPATEPGRWAAPASSAPAGTG